MKPRGENQIVDNEACAPEGFVPFVAQRFGDATARQIEQSFGGRRIYLAADPEDHHVLAKVIGVEKAKIIAREFGYGLVDIALGSTNRRVLVEQACLEGQSVTAIARAFGCCTRTVSKARARLRRQGRME